MKMTAELFKITVQKEIEEAWNNGNLNILDELYAEEMIYHIPPCSESVGLDTYKEFIRYTRKRYPAFRLTIQEIIIEGNSVLVVLKHERKTELESASLKVPAIAKNSRNAGHVFYYIVSGKPVEMWNYVD
jgi:predicted ester cyclase